MIAVEAGRRLEPSTGLLGGDDAVNAEGADLAAEVIVADRGPAALVEDQAVRIEVADGTCPVSLVA